MSDVVVPRQSAKIAVKYARLPEVKGLFEELSRRDETLAVMQAEFIESIKRNRAVREGKPVQLSKYAKRTIEGFDADAEKARAGNRAPLKGDG